jgi:hypothetical protein
MISLQSKTATATEDAAEALYVPINKVNHFNACSQRVNSIRVHPWCVVIKRREAHQLQRLPPLPPRPQPGQGMAGVDV